jgi:hypothetical protein
MKNTVKAEELNHMFHAALSNPAPSISAIDNFDRIFPNTDASSDFFTEDACTDEDPCMKRLRTSQVNNCPSVRFVKKKFNASGKTFLSFACRNGKSPLDAQRDISCESFTGIASLNATQTMTMTTAIPQIAVGQKVSAAGIPLGTVVSSVSGAAVTLSSQAQETVSSRRISFEPLSPANLANTADIRVFSCVYDQGTAGANMAISVWSYMNLTNKLIKVQEDNF